MADQNSNNDVDKLKKTKSEQNERLRIAVKTNLDVHCSRLIKDFKGIITSAHINDNEQFNQSSTTTPSSSSLSSIHESAQTMNGISEQEQLRRDAFHISVHAERIAVTGEALLTMIDNMRQNIIMNDSVSIDNEIALIDEKTSEMVSGETNKTKVQIVSTRTNLSNSNKKRKVDN